MIWCAGVPKKLDQLSQQVLASMGIYARLRLSFQQGSPS